MHQRRGGVKRGDVVEVSIRGSAFGGEGVGRIDGQVVFVPFAVPGDLAEVEVLEVKKAFARGRALRILQPSADRIEPRCSAHGRCGGCCYQQLRYERQLALKETQAAEIFRRIGGIPEPPVKPILASPLPFRYRDRAEFHFRTGGTAVFRRVSCNGANTGSRKSTVARSFIAPSKRNSLPAGTSCGDARACP